MAYTQPIVLRNVKVLFPNFAGSVGPMNQRGSRSFVIEFPDAELAEELRHIGLKVKEVEAEDGLHYAYRLKIVVNPNSYNPPVITQALDPINPGDLPTIEKLEVEEWGDLDSLNIRCADVSFVPSYIKQFNTWSAYARRVYVKIGNDPEARLNADWDNMSAEDYMSSEFKRYNGNDFVPYDDGMGIPFDDEEL